jgi:hypothetical protein
VKTPRWCEVDCTHVAYSPSSKALVRSTFAVMSNARKDEIRHVDTVDEGKQGQPRQAIERRVSIRWIHGVARDMLPGTTYEQIKYSDKTKRNEV